MGKFLVDPYNLEDSRTETGNGTGAGRVNVQSTRALEVWVIVTATSGTGQSMNMLVESSPDEADDTTFKEQIRISAINAVGAFSVPINRADHALGLRARVKWEISGTTPSFTFKVVVGRME